MTIVSIKDSYLWMKNIEKVVFSILFLIAIIFRAFYLSILNPADYDEAGTGLMAISILKGNFPIFYWGEAYSGTLESHLTAIIFYFFGPGSFTVRIVPIAFSILLIYLIYQLARDLFGPEVGLISMLLAAFPPPAFLMWSVIAKNGYIEIFALGTLILLIALRIPSLKEGDKAIRYYFLLGLLSGLTWWTQFLSVSYIIAAGLFLLLRDRALPVRVIFGLIGFFIGSLPVWLYNIENSFRSFSMGGISFHHFLPNLRYAFGGGIPFLFGKDFFLWLYLGGAFYLLWRLLRGKSRGGEILLFHLILILFLFSIYYLTTPKYLFPIITTFPILSAIIIAEIWKRLKIVAVLALSFIFMINTTGLGSDHKDIDNTPLIRFMETKGIHHAYVPWHFALRLAFDSKDRMIFSDYFGFRNPPYSKFLREVDAAEKVAMIANRNFMLSPDVLEENLKVSGASYEKEVIGNYVVFHSFRPPDLMIRSIIPQSWKGYSESSGDDPSKAFDRDIRTRWKSSHPQKTGMSFKLDLGKERKAKGISILFGEFHQDIPQGYIIEGSLNGIDWQEIVKVKETTGGLYWHKSHPKLDYYGRIQAFFPEKNVRFIRIKLTADKPRNDFSIAEIFVYGDGNGTPSGRRAYEEAFRVEDEGGWEFNLFSPIQTSERYLIERMDWKRIIEGYRKAISEDNEMEDAHYRVGIAYARLGLPESPSLRRGIILEELGLWQEAAEEYRMVLEGLGNNSIKSIHIHLRDCYERLGDKGGLREMDDRLLREFSPVRPMDINFGGKIRFLGYDIDKRQVRRGEAFHITYYWEGLKKMDKDYAVFVHSTSQGRIYFQNDHYPLKGKHPTSRWVKGEYVKEGYTVRIPEDIPTGEYKLIVGVWDPEKRKRLKVKDIRASGEKDSITIGTIRVME